MCVLAGSFIVVRWCVGLFICVLCVCLFVCVRNGFVWWNVCLIVCVMVCVCVWLCVSLRV